MAKLQKWLSLLLAGLLVAGGWQLWQLYQREQRHLHDRVSALAGHAAQMADAARVLQQEPASTSARFRLAIHGHSFEAEGAKLPGSTLGGGCTNRSICPERFSSGEVSVEELRLIEERFLQVEIRLNHLANKGMIGQRDLDALFTYLDEALQELWEVQSTTAGRTIQVGRSETDERQKELLRLQIENDRLNRELAALQAQLESLRSNPHTGLFHGSRQLEEQGLANPVTDLVSDLKARADLIPIPGVLGGTMAFRNEGDWVITDKWVLASFDDGHTGGTALLEYQVSDGQIQWSLIDFARH